MVYPNQDEVYQTDIVYEISEFSGELKPDEESRELAFFALDEVQEPIMPTQIDYIRKFVAEKQKTIKKAAPFPNETERFLIYSFTGRAAYLPALSCCVQSAQV